MLMRKKNWPELTALTSYFFVELPGIEPAAPSGLLASEQQFRSVSLRFVPAGYLRLRSQALTALRRVGHRLLSEDATHETVVIRRAFCH
jgi:hypothetical protein